SQRTCGCKDEGRCSKSFCLQAGGKRGHTVSIHQYVTGVTESSQRTCGQKDEEHEEHGRKE
ncbi:hypothetical protein, partial [Morganella sp. BCCO 40_0016]|uniref:hypothetical protein n=1 Tax=Morganella sp. BCCO 40_0016 TaxID=3068326 RepID=UPI0029430D26